MTGRSHKRVEIVEYRRVPNKFEAVYLSGSTDSVSINRYATSRPNHLSRAPVLIRRPSVSETRLPQCCIWTELHGSRPAVCVEDSPIRSTSHHSHPIQPSPHPRDPANLTPSRNTKPANLHGQTPSSSFSSSTAPNAHCRTRLLLRWASHPHLPTLRRRAPSASALASSRCFGAPLDV